MRPYPERRNWRGRTLSEKGCAYAFRRAPSAISQGQGRTAVRPCAWPIASDGGRAKPTVAERSRGPRLRSGTGKLSNTPPRLRSVTCATGRAWPRCLLTTALSWRLQSPFSILHSPNCCRSPSASDGYRAHPTVTERIRRWPSASVGGQSHPSLAERSRRWPSAADGGRA